MLLALSSIPPLSDYTSSGELPLQTQIREKIADRLEAFGARMHLEEQRMFALPGAHPEAGWMNVPRYVNREEYDKHQAEHPSGTGEDQLRELAGALLGQLNPKLLHTLKDLTPQQRAVFRERQRAQLAENLAHLEALKQQVDEDDEGDSNE